MQKSYTIICYKCRNPMAYRKDVVPTVYIFEDKPKKEFLITSTELCSSCKDEIEYKEMIVKL